MLLEENNHKVKDFLERSNALKNPLIYSFLEDKEYYTLFKKAILDPTQKNKDTVEELFKSHYEKIRLNTYFKNLIRYYAIDFDKKIRKIRNRFVLILDKSLGKDHSELPVLREFIENEVESPQSNHKRLYDEIGNELLYKALDVLTESQYKILDLIYVKNLSKSEIANLLNTTPQNISNIHKNAIKKLKKRMEGDSIGTK